MGREEAEREGGKHDVNLSDLLRMVERLVENQDDNKQELLRRLDQTEANLAKRIERLENKVIGDGDDTSLLVRVRDNERAIRYIEQQLESIKEQQQENTELLTAWRNRAIGIMLVVPILTTLLVIVVSHVLGIALK